MFFSMHVLLFSFYLTLLPRVGSIDIDDEKTPFNEFNVYDYHSYKEIIGFLTGVAKEKPGLFRLIPLNQTTADGHKLYVLEAGENDDPSNPFIWIDCGIHGRDWVTITTALHIVRMLFLNSQLVKKVTWRIMIANPDGYEYSRSVFDGNKALWRRWWRRNRSRCTEIKDYNCGVDLNRNFDCDWGLLGTDNKTKFDTYGGPSSASEVETQAIQDFLMRFSNSSASRSAYLTLHSYGHLWLYPYANTYVKSTGAVENPPAFYEKLKEVAQKAVQKIKEESHVTYQTGHVNQYTDDVSTGGSADWANRKAGIKFAYTIVLSPSHNATKHYMNGFLVSPKKTESIAKNVWPGICTVYEAVIAGMS